LHLRSTLRQDEALRGGEPEEDSGGLLGLGAVRRGRHAGGELDLLAAAPLGARLDPRVRRRRARAVRGSRGVSPQAGHRGEGFGGAAPRARWYPRSDRRAHGRRPARVSLRPFVGELSGRFGRRRARGHAAGGGTSAPEGGWDPAATTLVGRKSAGAL